MRWTLRCVACIGVLALLPATLVHAEETIQLDPFAQATRGHPNCPAPSPPLLTREQVERGAHARAERGTRCAMEGRCEPGGAYRRDPEINEAVRSSLAADPRFATASVWITTSRGWVTLQGCVRDAVQRFELAEAVRKVPRVVQVFDQTRVVTVRPPRLRTPRPPARVRAGALRAPGSRRPAVRSARRARVDRRSTNRRRPRSSSPRR